MRKLCELSQPFCASWDKHIDNVHLVSNRGKMIDELTVSEQLLDRVDNNIRSTYISIILTSPGCV